MWTNINSLVVDKDYEKVKQRAREWYAKNRQRALDRIKTRYSENKDNPEFRARILEQHRKWRATHPTDAKVHALTYYYRNKEKCLTYQKKKIHFLDKEVHLDFNPRQGICSQCGYEGFTAIHHKMYDLSDPMAFTEELCVKCHKKEPKGVVLV